MKTTVETRDHVFSLMAEVLQERNRRAIHCFLLSHSRENDFEEALNRARWRGSSVSFTKIQDDLFRVRIGSDTGRRVAFAVRIDDHWVAFVEGGTSELRGAMESFSRRAYPFLKLVHLPSGHILRLLDKVRSKYEHLLVTEGTICTEGQTFRNWKKEPLEFSSSAMLAMARKEDGKWTSISLKALAPDGDVFSCRVYERGHLTVYGGSFPEFYSNILLPYFGAALSYQRSFAGRERRDTESGPVIHPIAFDLGTEIDRRSMRMLEDELIGDYAGAVVHPGNPLLMLQLCDRDDGSSYDVYAFGKRLEIIPHQRASPGSLTELVARLTDLLPTGVQVIAE